MILFRNIRIVRTAEKFPDCHLRMMIMFPGLRKQFVKDCLLRTPLQTGHALFAVMMPYRMVILIEGNIGSGANLRADAAAAAECRIDMERCIR